MNLLFNSTSNKIVQVFITFLLIFYCIYLKTCCKYNSVISFHWQEMYLIDNIPATVVCHSNWLIKQLNIPINIIQDEKNIQLKKSFFFWLGFTLHHFSKGPKTTFQLNWRKTSLRCPFLHYFRHRTGTKVTKNHQHSIIMLDIFLIWKNPKSLGWDSNPQSSDLG
jgi:hypothetical protein